MARTDTTAPRARVAPELRRWRNALFAIFIVSGLFLSSWVSRVPGVRDSLKLPTDVVGLILLGVSIGAIVGLVVAPPLQARVGTKRGIAIVAVTAALGLAVVGFGATVLVSFPIVVVGLALLGLGNGAIDVMMNVSAAAVEKRIGRTIMPLMHACFSIGTVVGAGIGAACAALGISIFWHFTVMAVITIAAAAYAVRYVPNTQDVLDKEAAGGLDSFDDPAMAVAPRRRSFGETIKSQITVWADWRLVLIGVVMLGMAFAEGSANDWIALASVDGHGLTNAGGALVLDVFVAAMTLGRVIGGPAVDRIGRVWSIRLTAGLGVIGLLAFILLPHPAAYITGVVLWGLGASLGFPLGMSAAADDEQNATARVSAVAMIGYLAFLAGPPVIGFLGQQFGILNALYVVLILLVAAFVCAPALRHREHHVGERMPQPDPQRNAA
ncbi:MFS transporter [Planctomonas sp. JC2975]|uniref:MFS transporter n=1 Tax=Planctomonas sp. JC2975 TaxID=2729626 RepID=UPI00147433DD|nr:MFS transporter [Planctomonas sp. JC2975]NNC12653.1 MFS transporter [Planctomonas sp. JC2975]